VVCVAGLASSALENHVPSYRDWFPCCLPPLFRVSYCSIKALVSNPERTLQSLRLRLTTGELSDGREVQIAESVSGVRIRPVRGTAGISTLNPGEWVPVDVWRQLVNSLGTDFNCQAFNYDWRRWGDQVYAERLTDMFRAEIEEAYGHGSGDDRKVTVVAHSMGAPVTLYCLSALGDDWAQQYIEQVILVAPAHMGSPSMLPNFAHGPLGATHSFIPAPHFLEHHIGDITATWACMVAEMPMMKVGTAEPWPEDHVFAKTPTREYGREDMGRFLDDVAACTGGREFGPALWPGVQELCGKMRAPAVATSIIYSAGDETIAQVTYASDDLGAAPEISRTEPGDGTITAASIEAVAKAWQQDGADVRLFKAEGRVSHKDLIACSQTLQLIPKLLEGAEVQTE